MFGNSFDINQFKKKNKSNFIKTAFFRMLPLALKLLVYLFIFFSSVNVHSTPLFFSSIICAIVFMIRWFFVRIEQNLLTYFIWFRLGVGSNCGCLKYTWEIDRVAFELKQTKNLSGTTKNGNFWSRYHRTHIHNLNVYIHSHPNAYKVTFCKNTHFRLKINV